MNTDTLKELEALLASYEKPGNSNIDFASRIKKILARAKQEESQKPTAPASLVDELAELEHDQWMRIRKATFSKAVELENGSYTINPVQARDWKNMLVPYNELSEELKEYDRVEARKVLEILSRYTPTEPRPQEQGLRDFLLYLQMEHGGWHDPYIQGQRATGAKIALRMAIEKCKEYISRHASPVKEEHATDKGNESCQTCFNEFCKDRNKKGIVCCTNYQKESTSDKETK